MAFSSTIFEVNLKYPELALIDSNLLKKINKFIIHNDYYGISVFIITHSDDVYAFGSNVTFDVNFWSRLGFGNGEEVKEPKIIPELSGKKVIDIKCGDYFCVALTQTGQIYTFGLSSGGRTGNGENIGYQKPIEISVDNQTIIAIDCTGFSTFVLTQSGQIYWFGNLAYTPTKVDFPSEVNIKSISCGYLHILALTEEGKVFSWFRNEYGQLGLGHNNGQKNPQMIPLNENIKQIFCGDWHSLLLTTDGKVYSMGNNNSGQLGIGNKENKNIPQLVLSGQTEICCYYGISMSLDLNNKLYIWGNINGTVVSPILSELTSFQEVVNKYAKQHSTLKPIKVYNIKQSDKEVQTEVNTEERSSKTIESKEQLEPTIELFKAIKVKTIEQNEKDFQTDIKVNTEEKCSQKIESKEKLEPKESNSNKIMIKAFNNPENCDLKFRLKSKDNSEFKDIYCHKWFVKESSEYIKSLIENKMKTIGTTEPKDKLSTSTELTECRNCLKFEKFIKIYLKTIEIQINDYSYESYYQYLKSLYTDSIDSEDMEELLEILSITEQYLDFDKKNKCLELIKEKTNIENVCSVYSNAIKFNSVNLREYAFEIMAENMTDLVETQDYKNMDTKYAKQLFTEYLIRQKNDGSK